MEQNTGNGLDANKISFIEASYDWQDRMTDKIKSYGIQRLYGYVVSKNLVKEGEVVYTDFTFDKGSNPDIIMSSRIFAFSVMHPNYLSSLNLAKELKRRYPDSTIIFGGPSVTDLKKEMLEVHDYVDYLISGINEHAFYRLCDYILNQSKKNDIKKIPNVYYRDSDENATLNEIEYPPKNWQKIVPKEIDNEIPTRYISDQYMILGSLGCGHNCNFCNINQSQPKLYEREFKYMIDEIKTILEEREKNNNFSRIKIQIIHQNFTKRLKQFVKNLKKHNLLRKIESIAFNTRADTFLAAKKEFKKVLDENNKTIFVAYVGIENYDNEELLRINKGLDAITNFQATEELITIEKTNDNFDYLLSFIGFNKRTTRKNIETNIEAFEELFIRTNSFKNIHYLMLSPLRTNMTFALKRKERRLGYYPKDFYEYPRDESLKETLLKFEAKIKILPDFRHRKDVFYRSVLLSRGKEYAKNHSNFIWAEVYIFKALLDGNEELADQIISKSRSDFVFLSQIV